jgi:hypothetical protein
MLAREMHFAKRACELGPRTGVPFDQHEPSRIDSHCDID